MRNALTTYTNVIHTSTNGIHALKLIRPSTEPSIRIGVIAANTNWKYTSEAIGKWNGGPSVIDGITAWPSSAPAERTVPDLPQNVSKNPLPWPMGVPKPILKPHRTHATRTSEKATNVSIMLLTDQRFCIPPPYRTARPGRLISPTNVAAVICQALSPGFSHVGYALQDMCLRFLPLGSGARRFAHAAGSAPIAARMKSG